MPRPARSTGTTTTSPRHDASFRRTERRVDRWSPRWHVSQSLGRQQHADAVGGAAEFRWLRPDVAQLHQGVVDERMVHDVNGHALNPRFNGFRRSNGFMRFSFDWFESLACVECGHDDEVGGGDRDPDAERGRGR